MSGYVKNMCDVFLHSSLPRVQPGYEAIAFHIHEVLRTDSHEMHSQYAVFLLYTRAQDDVIVKTTLS